MNDQGRTPDDSVQEVSVLTFASSIAIKIYQNTNALQGKAVYFSGQFPYMTTDLRTLLPQGIVHRDLNEKPPLEYDDPTTVFIVLGQEDFDKDEIERFVQETHRGAAFLPQEGFLDLVFFGYDWWHENLDELNQSLEYHEGLQFVKSLEGFEWPSTDASESDGTSSADVDYASETE